LTFTGGDRNQQKLNSLQRIQSTSLVDSVDQGSSEEILEFDPWAEIDSTTSTDAVNDLPNSTSLSVASNAGLKQAPKEHHSQRSKISSNSTPHFLSAAYSQETPFQKQKLKIHVDSLDGGPKNDCAAILSSEDSSVELYQNQSKKKMKISIGEDFPTRSDTNLNYENCSTIISHLTIRREGQENTERSVSKMKGSTKEDVPISHPVTKSEKSCASSLPKQKETFCEKEKLPCTKQRFFSTNVNDVEGPHNLDKEKEIQIVETNKVKEKLSPQHLSCLEENLSDFLFLCQSCNGVLLQSSYKGSLPKIYDINSFAYLQNASDPNALNVQTQHESFQPGQDEKPFAFQLKSTARENFAIHRCCTQSGIEIILLDKENHLDCIWVAEDGLVYQPLHCTQCFQQSPKHKKATVVAVKIVAASQQHVKLIGDIWLLTGILTTPRELKTRFLASGGSTTHPIDHNGSTLMNSLKSEISKTMHKSKSLRQRCTVHLDSECPSSVPAIKLRKRKSLQSPRPKKTTGCFSYNNSSPCSFGKNKNQNKGTTHAGNQTSKKGKSKRLGTKKGSLTKPLLMVSTTKKKPLDEEDDDFM